MKVARQNKMIKRIICMDSTVSSITISVTTISSRPPVASWPVRYSSGGFGSRGREIGAQMSLTASRTGAIQKTSKSDFYLLTSPVV
jgi:hypothetical protein